MGGKKENNGWKKKSWKLKKRKRICACGVSRTRDIWEYFSSLTTSPTLSLWIYSEHIVYIQSLYQSKVNWPQWPHWIRHWLGHWGTGLWHKPKLGHEVGKSKGWGTYAHCMKYFPVKVGMHRTWKIPVLWLDVWVLYMSFHLLPISVFMSGAKRSVVIGVKAITLYWWERLWRHRGNIDVTVLMEPKGQLSFSSGF